MFPILRMGKSDTAPTNKIRRRSSSEQCPQTRSCHESEHLVSDLLGQTYLWASLFPDPGREQPAISARRQRLVDSWSTRSEEALKCEEQTIASVYIVSEAYTFSSNA